VNAGGEESLGTFTGRSAMAVAELLGQQATVYPTITHPLEGAPNVIARPALDDCGRHQSSFLIPRERQADQLSRRTPGSNR
jgi:hypothetical protein